jgi:hypothetical protein
MGKFLKVNRVPHAEKAIFLRLLKNTQMQGACGAFQLPIRQAILKSEAYLDVCRNDEG